MSCKYINHDPDKMFRKFKVLEFPTTFLGLAFTLDLDLEMDATGPVCLRTNLNNTLMTFEEAREISAAHRAFTVTQCDKRTLKIQFKPTNECISKLINTLYHTKLMQFVADIRAIKADGLRCCNDILHSQIGCYFFHGSCEYCNISHSPNNVNFDVVRLKGRVVRTVRIRNDSKLPAKMTYIKVAGFHVNPRSFLLPVNCSKKVEITFIPTSYQVPKTLVFSVRNVHDPYTEPENSGVPITDFNFIKYTIELQAKVACDSFKKLRVMKSLQSVWEPNPDLTYINQDLIDRNNKMDLAHQFLKHSVSMGKNRIFEKEKRVNQLKCYPEPQVPKDPRTEMNFCKRNFEVFHAIDLFDIILTPHCLDFGKIGVYTYGQKDLLIKNNTKHDIDIKFLQHNSILYSENKRSTYRIKLQAKAETAITIFCYGPVVSNQESTFTYTINNIYHREHLFRLIIDDAVLSLCDYVLKFGMVTENYVNSVPLKIYNQFNVPIDFEWKETDTPFKIIPFRGTIPKHSFKICEIEYNPLADNKSKLTHEIVLFSEGRVIKNIVIELVVITKKLLVKFINPTVNFDVIPLNLTVTKQARLENSTREIAIFYVEQPLLPGVTVEPMVGLIKPKAVLTFTITVHLECLLEFNFDLTLRINNKENVTIVVTGNVVEPKIYIQPKHIQLPRIAQGLITYVPIKLINSGPTKSLIEVFNTKDENIFDVYHLDGQDKKIIDTPFTVDPGKTITVFVKVYDYVRREYHMYLPFRINNLLGPPNGDSASTDLNYYIHKTMQLYDRSTSKINVRTTNKDIPYCSISGVFTVSWLEFSTEDFEIIYDPNSSNQIIFSMKNISKYIFNININISKLEPHFTLEIDPNYYEVFMNQVTTENFIKFRFEPGTVAGFIVKFHPQARGKFVSTALLTLETDGIPFHNLAFIGRRELPELSADNNRIVFPPCLVGRELSKTINLNLEVASPVEYFSCSSKEEKCVKLEFVESELMEINEKTHTIVKVKITVQSDRPHSRNMAFIFIHASGATCNVEIFFCFTNCPMTLHTDIYVSPEDNPYPYYPLETQTALYEYMERCMEVLQNWMYYIGFRREMFAVIPTTLQAVAVTMICSTPNKEFKVNNTTILNFFKRMVGPAFMKNLYKPTQSTSQLETLAIIKEIINVYDGTIKLLRQRGAVLPILMSRYLLTFEQFKLYVTHHDRPKYACDEAYVQILLNDVDLYNRLTKQCWFDYLFQTYKVFILDSCFFECACIDNKHRDIVQILIGWYNEQINIAQINLFRKINMPKPKPITNITTDLIDGIAIICTIYNHCPFLRNNLATISEINDKCPQNGIVHNFCIISEALNNLRIYFPLSSQDFLKPNFIHMLMFCVHLYVTLPMFIPKCSLQFNPPLMRTSTRLLNIFADKQETILYNFTILNNKHNCFSAEKVTLDNGKKCYLNVKYWAKFISGDEALLLVHGYNTSRIFDTYATFDLVGSTGALIPLRKCKATAPIYRPVRVDIPVFSPFEHTATYSVHLSEIEPTHPVVFKDPPGPSFSVKRLKLMQDNITLTAPSAAYQGHYVPESVIQNFTVGFQMCCLSIQMVELWVWFRSSEGEFFIKISSQPRFDMPLETLHVPVSSWPMDACSCGEACEACECSRTTVIHIPHRNDLTMTALRATLLEFSTPLMVEIFDNLVVSETGRIICLMLLIEHGTNPTEVMHLLRPETTYHVTSRTVQPRTDRVTLKTNSDAELALPLTIPPNWSRDKFTITLISECSMDIRNYKIVIVPPEKSKLIHG